MASGASGELNKIITRWKTLNFTDQLYVWSIYVWPTYMYGSVVMDFRPVTQRFQVQAPLWSLDTVGHALRKSTLSKKFQSNSSWNGYQLMLRDYCTSIELLPIQEESMTLICQATQKPGRGINRKCLMAWWRIEHTIYTTTNCMFNINMINIILDFTGIQYRSKLIFMAPNIIDLQLFLSIFPSLIYTNNF